VPRVEDLSEEEADLLGVALPTEEEREAEELRKVRVRQRDEMLLYCLRSDLFREWMMEIITSMGAFENPFGMSAAGFPDPLATQFALGRKSCGWQLWEIFDNLAPDLASLMRREATDRANLAERRSRR
jgi:hypothetical protein